MTVVVRKLENRKISRKKEHIRNKRRAEESEVKRLKFVIGKSCHNPGPWLDHVAHPFYWRHHGVHMVLLGMKLRRHLWHLMLHL